MKSKKYMGGPGACIPENFEKLSNLRLHFVRFEGSFIGNQAAKIERKTDYFWNFYFIIPAESCYSIIPLNVRPLFHYSNFKISVILIPLFLFTTRVLAF